MIMRVWKRNYSEYFGLVLHLLFYLNIIYIYIYVCVCVCARAQVCVYVYLYVYVCVITYFHTHMHTLIRNMDYDDIVYDKGYSVRDIDNN